MQLKDITVEFRHFDTHADAYFVIGKNKNKNSLKQYVVGWISRHQDHKLLAPHYFPDMESAVEHYGEAVAEDDQPDRKILEKDWQQNNVYKWEEDELETYMKKMTRAEILQLVQKVSKDYNLPMPRVTWIKKQEYSDYLASEHRLTLGHRDNISVLHEMAHTIHEQTHERFAPAHHSPAFVWTAIELYNRYANVPLNHLITTAQKDKLLGDINERQMALFLPRPAEQKKQNKPKGLSAP